MKKDVHIHPDGSADDCDLYRATNDQANWINDGKVARTLRFSSSKGSPFAQTEYTVYPGAPQLSGPITTNDKDKFPYDIGAAKAANEPAADPHIIIH